MKFSKAKVSSRSGETQIHYTQELPTGPGDFKIIANAAYVDVMGLKLSTPDDFENLAKAIGGAAKEHLVMRQALRAKLMGGL